MIMEVLITLKKVLNGAKLTLKKVLHDPKKGAT
jgi:hypothetical protein